MHRRDAVALEFRLRSASSVPGVRRLQSSGCATATQALDALVVGDGDGGVIGAVVGDGRIVDAGEGKRLRGPRVST